MHTNSSLLNNIAYRLCVNGGMTLEEARAYWFAVDCSMVPGTDYVQQSELLPWVLKTQGMDRYMTEMEKALDATRLRTADIPDVFDDDLALVTVTLPEVEHFEDGNWKLMILTVNVDEISRRFQSISHREGEYADVLDGLAEILGVDPALLPAAEEIEQNPDHAWERFEKEINSEDLNSRLSSMGEEEKNKLTELVRRVFFGTIFMSSGAAGQDGHTVRVVCRPGITVPILYRLEVDSEMHVHSAGLAAYTFGTWLDLGAIIQAGETDAAQTEETEQEPVPADTESPEPLPESGEESLELPPEMLDGIMDMLGDWLYELLFFNVKGGEVNTIPSDGLEEVQAVPLEDVDLQQKIDSLPTSGGSAFTENESAEEAPAMNEAEEAPAEEVQAEEIAEESEAA